MDMFLGVVRAVLAAAGGWAVGKGYVDQASADQIIGAVIVIGTAGWSVWSKKQA